MCPLIHWHIECFPSKHFKSCPALVKPLNTSTHASYPHSITAVIPSQHCEQNILMFGEEITHWSEFEEECLKKDQEISGLQEELTELTIYHNEDMVRGQGGSRDSSALYISDFCDSIVAHTCTELEVVTFSFAVVEKVPNLSYLSKRKYTFNRKTQVKVKVTQ